jgi:hypothetical protein
MGPKPWMRYAGVNGSSVAIACEGTQTKSRAAPRIPSKPVGWAKFANGESRPTIWFCHPQSRIRPNGGPSARSGLGPAYFSLLPRRLLIANRLSPKT